MPAKTKTQPVKKKAAAKAVKKSTKKPKWTTVTYKKIEARRTELGYSKSAMAVALGVTNSTYHNWRRGTTVPHPNQQEQIRDLMVGLTPGAPKAPKAKAKAKAAPKTRAVTKRGPKTRGKARVAPGTGRKAGGDGNGGKQNMKQTNSNSHPFHPSADAAIPGGAIAPGVVELTGAWINSQTKAPSAGSVFAFVKGLKTALREG